MSDYQGYPGQQPATGGWAQQPHWSGPAQPGAGWNPNQTYPQPAAPGYPATAAQPVGYDPRSPYGQSPYSQPHNQQWQPGAPGGPSAPPPRKRTALVVTVAAVVVALLAATGVWYFGFRDSKGAGGQTSPQEAANAMLVSLSQKDPVGVADQLAPSEAKLFGDLTGDVLTELKRLQIVTPDASQGNLTGATVTVAGLTYDPSPDTINDHVSVVKLTGGTITITTDPAKLPLTDKIKQAADQSKRATPTTKTYNIADEVAKRGGPIRVATVLEGGKWYPSLFYTAADTWAQQKHLGSPTAADAIAATGGDTPEATMDAVIKALSDRDLAGFIALLPPDEMAVLHDYGQMIVRAANIGKNTSAAVKVSNTSWNVSDTTGGKLVSIKSLTVTVNGTSTTIAHDGDSLTVSTAGKAPVTVTDATIDSYLDELGTGGSVVDPTLKDIIKREYKQVLGIGFVLTQTNGKWFFSPLRSYVGIFTQLLKGLQPSDIDYFLTQIHR